MGPGGERPPVRSSSHGRGFPDALSSSASRRRRRAVSPVHLTLRRGSHPKTTRHTQLRQRRCEPPCRKLREQSRCTGRCPRLRSSRCRQGRVYRKSRKAASFTGPIEETDHRPQLVRHRSRTVFAAGADRLWSEVGPPRIVLRGARSVRPSGRGARRRSTAGRCRRPFVAGRRSHRPCRRGEELRPC